MRLYEKSGFLNISEIDKETERLHIPFIFILGARQVGKTFGTLQLMLKEDRRFILMRRTQTEADFLTSGVLNPFLPVDRNVSVRKSTQYTGEIIRNKENENEYIGMTLALSTVSKIRGFSAVDYTDLVYDEFIPERHTVRIRDEGDAFLNAIVTISGNRELEGRKPLKVWLLANTNNFDNDILRKFGIQSVIEKMQGKEQEYSLQPERGIAVFLPASDAITGRRSKTALFRAISEESSFTQMALENKFSYNNTEHVEYRTLSEYLPVLSVSGRFTVYRHKSKKEIYVTSYSGASPLLTDSEYTRKYILRNYPSLKPMFLNGKMKFATLKAKTEFLSFMRF